MSPHNDTKQGGFSGYDNVTWSGRKCVSLLSGTYDEIGLPTEIVPMLNIYLTSAMEHESREPVAKCCSPSRLFVVDNCTMWCDMPEKYMNLSKDGSSLNPLNAIADCIRDKRGNSSEHFTSIMLSDAGLSGGKGGCNMSLALWALLIAGYTIATS
ncbi:hypothetical protein K4F52_007910 [Lecanicillium sp. MT-2017a]|nr:hypothetical protein K4F52_007910 [Lecanicillium sp. MT-2017a]